MDGWRQGGEGRGGGRDGHREGAREGRALLTREEEEASKTGS